MFSARSTVATGLNRVTVALESRRARGLPILDLTVSNPTTAGIPYDSDALREALSSEQFLHYRPEALGLRSARAAVARAYAAEGYDLTAEDLVLTASTSEAYAFAFKLLCDAGDEVLVPAPSYPLLEHLALLEQVQARPYGLSYEGGWHVDFASIRAQLSPRTRAIIVVNPNNPTGSYVKRWELAALLELGVPIISDEVFSSYAFAADDERAGSVLSASDGLVLALDGLSKRAGLPQLKLAWMALAGRGELVREARARLELIADTFLSPGTPVQLALPRLFEIAASTQQAIARRVRRNYERLCALVQGSPLSVLRCEGGWYAVLRLPRTQPEEDWVLAFIEQGVWVQPGYFYDFAEEAYAVVSLLTAEAELEQGGRRLVEYVAAHA